MAEVRCYSYSSVYKGGKEFQLEQVRASLPRYRMEYRKASRDDVVYYSKNKVYPSSGGELQLEQVRAMFPKYQPACEMEMTQIVTTVTTLKVNPVQRFVCSL